MRDNITLEKRRKLNKIVFAAAGVTILKTLEVCHVLQLMIQMMNDLIFSCNSFTIYLINFSTLHDDNQVLIFSYRKYCSVYDKVQERWTFSLLFILYDCMK